MHSRMFLRRGWTHHGTLLRVVEYRALCLYHSTSLHWFLLHFSRSIIEGSSMPYYYAYIREYYAQICILARNCLYFAIFRYFIFGLWYFCRVAQAVADERERKQDDSRGTPFSQTASCGRVTPRIIPLDLFAEGLEASRSDGRRHVHSCRYLLLRPRLDGGKVGSCHRRSLWYRPRILPAMSPVLRDARRDGRCR